MRSSKTALWVFGGILAAAGLTYLVIRNAKKAESDIDEQEKQDKEDLDELGVDTEILRNHGVSLTENLVRGIQQTIRHSPDWDLDVIDPDVVLEKDTIIHLTESEFKGKSQLDFVFELPNYTGDSYKFPKIKDFKLAFDKAAEEMWAHKVVKSDRPYRRLEAYVVMVIKKDDEEKTYIKRIPADWYKQYATEQNDGVARFYEDYNDPKKHEEMKEDLKKNFIKDYVTGSQEGFEFRVEEIFLGWRISFQIQNNNRGQGINLISAIKCLQYLTDEFEVHRDGGKGVVKFENILFHDSDTTSELSPNFFNLDGEVEILTY